MFRKALSVLGSVVAAGAAVAAFALPASASTQFSAKVEAPNRILVVTGQDLPVGTPITVGLDGFKTTVRVSQENGGGDLVWLTVFLPSKVAPIGTTVVFNEQ